MKKLLGFLFVIMFLFGLSVASTLYVEPNNGTIGNNCVQGFELKMNALGEKILGVDLEVDTSMEYVDFVPNKDLFEYYLPPRIDNGTIVLGAFSMPGNEIDLDNIVIGTLYLKNISNNLDSFIKIVFDGEGITTDSNLSIGGGFDKLLHVGDGKYLIDEKMSCIDNDIIEGGFGGIDYEVQMKEFNTMLKKKANIEKLKKILLNKFVLGSFFLLGIFVLVFAIKNKGKKLI